VSLRRVASVASAYAMSVSDKDLSGLRMVAATRRAQLAGMQTFESQVVSRAATPIEYWASVLLVFFLLLLAAGALLVPIAAASGFGIPLVDPLDAFYVRVRGDRDLAGALALGVLLWLGQRRALGVWVGALTIEPIIDACLVIADPRGQLAYALAVHGSAAIYGLVLSWRLLRARPS
jgi:hypothetical protein